MPKLFETSAVGNVYLKLHSQGVCWSKVACRLFDDDQIYLWMHQSAFQMFKIRGLPEALLPIDSGRAEGMP